MSLAIFMVKKRFNDQKVLRVGWEDRRLRRAVE